MRGSTSTLKEYTVEEALKIFREAGFTRLEMARGHLVLCKTHQLRQGFAAHAKQLGLSMGCLNAVKDNDTYFDQQKAPKLHLETLAWLRDRKVGLIGVDMPSVNALLDQHATVFDAEMPPSILELLTNLDKLPAEVTLISLPLKIQEGDGSPVRAVALID